MYNYPSSESHKKAVFLLERPFFTIGISYLVSLILAEYFSAEISFYLFIVFLVLFLTFLVIKRTRKDLVLPLVSLFSCLAFGVYTFSYKSTVAPVEALNNKDATITATVCELPYKSFGKYYYVLKTDEINLTNFKDKIPQNIKIRMSVSKGLNLDIYDKINCKVHFYTKDDEGAFSSRSYYRAKGINIFAYMHEYEDYTETVGTQKDIYYYCLKLKQNLISALRRVLSNDNASLAQGLLLGDKYNITEEVKDDFKNTGISHLLSVSGLHVSVITSLFVSLFLFFKFSKKAAYLLSCLGIVLFAGITGFSSSVIRASVMSIIYLIGVAFGKKADSLNSLGLAVLFICIFNPFSGGDIGLLLSVSSSLGIILLEPRLESIVKEKIKDLKHFKSFLNYLLPLICVTICATLFTLPITLLYFKEISLVSIISNILIAAPSTLMFTFTLLTAVFYLISPLRFLGMFFGIFSNWFLSYTTGMASVISKIPFSSVNTSKSFVAFWVASIILLLAVLLLLTKNNYKKYIKMYSLISLILLFTGVLSCKAFSGNTISLAVLDVGDGVSLVITKGEHCAVLAAGGDLTKENELTSYLDSNNFKKLDYLILDSFNDSNSIYTKDILKRYNPAILVMPNTEDIDDKISKAIKEDSSAYYYKDDANIKLWGSVKINVHYSKDVSYTKININDINLLSFSKSEDLAKITEEDLDCDILIESENFKGLGCVNSRYVVMSNSSEACKKNYKHIAQNGKIPMATGGDGSIVFDFTGDSGIVARRVKV